MKRFRVHGNNLPGKQNVYKFQQTSAEAEILDRIPTNFKLLYINTLFIAFVLSKVFFCYP